MCFRLFWITLWSGNSREHSEPMPEFYPGQESRHQNWESTSLQITIQRYESSSLEIERPRWATQSFIHFTLWWMELRFLEISNHVWNNQVQFTDQLGRVMPNRSRIQKSDSGSFQSPNGFLNSRMIMIETIRHANLAPGILARSIDFWDTGQGESWKCESWSSRRVSETSNPIITYLKPTNIHVRTPSRCRSDL